MKKTTLTISILALLLASGVFCSLAATPSFEENKGQFTEDFRFVVRDGGSVLGLSADRIELLPIGFGSGQSLHLEFSGGNRFPVLAGENRLPGKINYLVGPDPEAWITGLPTWSSVRYSSIYEGVDLVAGGDRGALSLAFDLVAGAGHENLVIGLDGLEPVALNGEGDLLIGSRMQLLAPEFVQQTAEGTITLDGTFILLAGNRLAFDLADRDIDRPLNIRIQIKNDRSATGRPARENATDLAIASGGELIVAGRTLPYGAGEAFVTRLSDDGRTVLFTTYFGGSGDDAPSAVAVDGSGRIVVAGRSTSGDDFPSAVGAAGTAGGGLDAFVVRLSPDGARLDSSALLGGQGRDSARDVIIGPDQSIWITGETEGGFPITPNAFGSEIGGATDSWLTHIGADGLEILFSSYLGGSGEESGLALAMDVDRNVLVAGSTSSRDFPLLAPLQAEPGSKNGDLFLAKLSPDGDLLFSTFLGEPGSRQFGTLARSSLPFRGRTDNGHAITLVEDETVSTAFPSTPGPDGFRLMHLNAIDAIEPDGETVLILARGSAGERPEATIVGSDPEGHTIFLDKVAPDGSSLLAAGCPGTINFDNDAGNGLWSELTNWDTDVLPTSTDDVCIDGFAVFLTSGLQNAGTLYASATGGLTVNGGTLTLASASEVHGGFTMSSGTVNGTGALTLNGSVDWSGGFFDGSGEVLVNGTVNISGDSIKLIRGRTFRNTSTVNWSAVGRFQVGGGSAFVNDGTWEVTTNNWIQNAFGGVASFTNNGTFRKTIGTGTTQIDAAFHNAGAVDIQTGTLRLGDGGVSSGSFGGAGLLYLRLGAQDLYEMQASSSLTVSALSVYSGTANISGEYNVPGVLEQNFGATNFNPGAVITTIGGVVAWNGGSVNFSTGNAVTLPTLKLGDLNWSQGGKLGGSDAVTVTGAFDWGQGAQITTSGGFLAEGTVSMTGGLGASLQDCEFRNTSIVNWSAGWMTIGGSSTIVNDGTWEVTNDGQISSSLGSFINNGTFRKTVGTGTTVVNTPFENNGIVEIQTGTVLMDGSATGSSTTGSFVGPGSIIFDGPTHELLSGSLLQVSQVQVGSPTNIAGEYDVPGTLTVQSTLTFQNGAVVTNMGDLVTRSTVAFETGSPFSLNAVTMTGGQLGGSDALTIDGTFEWSGGALSTTGGVLATSTVNMTGGVRHTVYNGTFRNTGTVNLSGTGSAELLNGGAFVNDGIWEITNDASVFTPNLNSLSFTNYGTFRKSGTPGMTRVSTIFNNYGSVEILEGTIESTSGYTQYSGSTILNGGFLTMTTSGRYNTANIQGGVLGGIGTLTGGVYNAGSVVPGLSAGLLNVGREYTTYTQSATGSLDIELGGLTAGTEHDQLTVSTDAVLDGTLNVTLINGYVPVEGDSFTILEATTVTGTFATVNTPALPGGTPWRVIYNATSVVLAVGDTCADVDSDGYAICDGNCTLDPADVCGDCDDGDAAIHPGATELTCDGIDQNCNGAADDTPDGDGDGSSVCDDCDDADSGIYPGATEVTCDGIDQNCNGVSDDTPDGDGDGYSACDECDDGNAAINPGAAEIACDGIDQNCNGAADDTPDTDADGDGYNICDECNDSDAAINPGAAEIACDGIDQNCNGLSDDGPDSDGDGYSECVDCDDANNAVNPGADEITCDEIDQNCNGLADDAPDADDDGYSECVDCDDSDETVNPGATEVCDDEADNDCDGLTDAADYADCGMGGPRTICAALGDDGSDPDVDKDVFVFTGVAGEQVTLNLEPVNAPALPGRAALILVDATSGAGELVGSDRTNLPNQLVQTLPSAGEYRIGVHEEPGLSFLSGNRFRGEYCLTLGSSMSAARSLQPTASVEGVEFRTSDSEPEPPRSVPGLGRTRSEEATPNRIRRR